MISTLGRAPRSSPQGSRFPRTLSLNLTRPLVTAYAYIHASYLEARWYKQSVSWFTERPDAVVVSVWSVESRERCTDWAHSEAGEWNRDHGKSGHASKIGVLTPPGRLSRAKNLWGQAASSNRDPRGGQPVATAHSRLGVAAVRNENATGRGESGRCGRREGCDEGAYCWNRGREGKDGAADGVYGRGPGDNELLKGTRRDHDG